MRGADDLVDALRPGLAGTWERFWFGQASLVRLAAFRIVVLVTALYGLHFHRHSLVQGAAEGEFVSRRFVPLYFLEVLGIGPMSPEVARVLYVVLFALLLVGIIGLFTRVVCALCAAGMLLWIGTAYSYGQPHHEYGLLAFSLLALPFGPVGERLSLDSLRARWREAKLHGRRRTPPVEDEGALLPIRFAQLTAALSYTFAGASKLRIGGADWLNGLTLQSFMREFDAPLTDLIAENLVVVSALSWGVILIQVTCLAAVVWRPLRWLFVPGIIGMHLGSMVTMDTGTFMGLWLLQAAFIDLERVPGFLASRLAGGPRSLRWLWLAALCFVSFWLVAFYVQKGPTLVPWLFLPVALAGCLGLIRRARCDLIFDGGCGICLRSMAIVESLDWGRRVRVLDATGWMAVSREHPELEQEACLEDIHLVDARRRVFRGFAAYRVLAWRLPLTLPLAPLLYLPGASHLGSRLYRHVATRRATTSCGLDGASSGVSSNPSRSGS